MKNERPLAKQEARDANRDPLSGKPGSHPVGTAIGAAAGGVTAGAAIGTVAGPVGTLVGGAVGAVVGGLAGKGIAELFDALLEYLPHVTATEQPEGVDPDRDDEPGTWSPV